MKNLMIGISGIRGIVGETCTPELVTRLGSAFGTYCEGGTIVVCRDTRVSGEMVKHALLGGLIATGCTVIDIGMCPTPTLTIMVRELHADGGVMISASHNPIQWNALKFYGNDGVILDEMQGREFLSVYYLGDFDYVPWDSIKEISKDRTAEEKHLNKVYAECDIDIIRRRKPKVVLDSCNAAGSYITPKMLEHLGCDVVLLHTKPDGYFPHNPEPIASNLTELCETVKSEHADIGLAQDADADRLALVDEQGKMIGEEMSLALAIEMVLSYRQAGPVVTNMSTSLTIRDICEAHGVDLYRTPVGEVNVSQKMQEVNAVIGGEGNGGVIDPTVGTGRDSLAAIALVLELLARRDVPLSELVFSFPRYTIVKKTMTCPRGSVGVLLKNIAEHYADKDIDKSDGIKITMKNSWIHVRRSATEPIVRIISEAPNQSEAEQLNSEVRELINSYISNITM